MLSWAVGDSGSRPKITAGHLNTSNCCLVGCSLGAHWRGSMQNSALKAGVLRIYPPAIARVGRSGSFSALQSATRFCARGRVVPRSQR